MWGAMHFLLGSVQRRRRRILLEEWLVLALRCLTLALVTLAMARPVAPPGGFTAWALAVVGVLAGTLCGVEMSLALAGIPFTRGGVDAALEELQTTSRQE